MVKDRVHVWSQTTIYQLPRSVAVVSNMYEGRPENKDRLRIALAQVIRHAIQTSPQAIFTCTPGDFHLLPTLKEFLGGRRFKSNEELKDVVKQWLNGLEAEVYDEVLQKLVIVYDKCLNVAGDYVEK